MSKKDIKDIKVKYEEVQSLKKISETQPGYIDVAHYYLNGLNDFTFMQFARAMKTRYEGDLKAAVKNNLWHPKLIESLTACWHDINELTFVDAIIEKNIEKRRVLFSIIGPENIFKNTDSELVDSQTITKKRIRWDVNNDPYEYIFEDTYKLYRILMEQLFKALDPIGKAATSWSRPNHLDTYIYAVQCKCTTTGREYWIMVPDLEQQKHSDWSWKSAFSVITSTTQTYITEYDSRINTDAIAAIASTIQIREAFPKRIWRQGDIIIVQPSEQEKDVSKNPLRSISKEEYLSLMYSET